MSPITASTISPLRHVDAGAAAPCATDCPQYRYAGGGRFLPANDAAREECRRWNQYADGWNARTASRSISQ